MKILIYSDNKWVIESIEKYIDFDYELLENVELERLNQRIDYIFVDMQVKNNGGPSIICLLYTSPSPRDNRVSRMPSSA